MKIELNIEKKHLYVIMALVVIVSGIAFAFAYGTSTPSVFGHSLGEIEIPDGGISATKIGSGTIQGDLNINGKVGIGVASQNYPLEVYHTQSGYDYSNIIASSNGDNVGFGLYNPTRKWELINIVSPVSTDYFGIRDQTLGLNRLIINQDGNVGIGTTDPAAKLDVAGNIKATGNLLVVGNAETTGTLTVGGDLKVTGKIGTLTSVTQVISDELWDYMTDQKHTCSDLIDVNEGFCFLTLVVVDETDGNTEEAGCRVMESGGKWQVCALALDGGDDSSWCEARCIKYS